MGNVNTCNSNENCEIVDSSEIPQQNANVNINNSIIEKYIKEKKVHYYNLIIFFKNSEANDLKNLIEDLNNQEEKSQSRLEIFLHLIIDIANNHREESLFTKIFQIIQYLKDTIKQTFTNAEIFKIFQSNKKILLFLFKNKIITIDDNIYNFLVHSNEPNGNRYCHFFYPEIKEFIGEQETEEIKNELLTIDSNIFDQFDQKREEGENDAYICTLIRKDSVEEFISYINRCNYPLDGKIRSSIFETNQYLLENTPTLIEYSAFFGSIQIFQYLQMNNVQLSPLLWLYTIHSNNAELIHLLESLDVKPPSDKYEKCYAESIKCHNNDFAKYFEDCLLPKGTETRKDEEIISTILQYHNYEFFPSNFRTDDEFFCLCFYGYQTIAKFFIRRELEISKVMNYTTLQKAASDNIVNVMYYQLLNRNKINYFTFAGSKNKLKKVAIPPTITSIEINSFSNYSLLTQVLIPSSVTLIGSSAFKKCTSLTQITIPSSVTSIGDKAFHSCSSLIKITLEFPSSLISIGDKAFKGCKSLTQFTIPSSVTSIRYGTFNNCYSLTQITILSSVTSIEDSAFEDCLSLTGITIPSSVTSIGNYAFAGCKSLTQITIPSSVTSIGRSAFVGCKSLTQIIIPSLVTSIGNFAFASCESLKQLTIPSSVTSIGDYAFEGCSSLTQITIYSSVTSIGDSSFNECPSIISKNAFGYCKLLNQISFPSTLISIEAQAFYDCSSLTQIALPSSLKYIKDGAFESCKSLKQVSFSSSLIFIGERAFLNCILLEQISIPDSVKSIGSEAFKKCTSLAQVSLSSSMTSINEGVFSGCKSLSQITIPSSIITIEKYAFYKCVSLVQVSIPSSVESIDPNAFPTGTDILYQ